MLPKQRLPIILAAVGAVLVLLMMIGGYAGRNMRQTTGSSAPLTAGYGSDTFGLALSSDSADYEKAANMVPPERPGYEAGYPDESLIPKERLIIKTATLAIVVQDVPTAVDAVVRYATENGGFEVSRNIQKNGLALNGSVTVRIPSKLFDAGLGEVKKLGEVESQHVDGQDVTEEFVDVEAQLKNLRATEAQFLDIMKRAQKIEDVLAVQRELSAVRSDIERLEGRKKYLEESARLSTVTVYFSTDPDQLPVVDDADRWKPLAVAKDSLRDLIEFGKGVVNFLIRLVVYSPIWLLVALVTLWLYRRVRRSRERHESGS